MTTEAEPHTKATELGPEVFDDYDAFLKQAIRDYYDRGWKSRRANFIALLLASGQMASVAKNAVVGEKGMRNVAVGAAGAVALRFALRWALGGPLGILMTAAMAASLVAFFIKNQREISQKIGRFRERIGEEKRKFEDIQSGYRANRYDARERNLMVDGQLKRFLADLDEA